jgi:L-aspartate oxidase
VRILVREGPERIRELIAFGARFSRDQSGDLSLGMEGGHSRRRIVRAEDLTGREVERTLVDAARVHPNITFFEHHTAIDLLCAAGACQGAAVLNEETGEAEDFLARATLLATGGCGQVYLHTTNPPIATGDGLAIAWRAGCEVANMEFIQFHPTTLYHPAAKSFLISEAVRGEGGILRRADGTAFMAEYDERKDLAPRDIVARAIDSEMKKTGDACVYLDITHLPAEAIRHHFPNIFARCLSFGIDITTDWIPVVPAAHYSCGGVLTDLFGRTNIDRLYACGEVACTGVHGANRLASNSLLEALVFGERSAVDALRRFEGWPQAVEATSDYIRGDPTRSSPGPATAKLAKIEDLRERLQTVMQRYVGIVRSNERLRKAKDAIVVLLDEAERTVLESPTTNEALELRNLLEVADLIVRSAKIRKESRGLHFTTDYPEPVESERHDTVLRRG